MPWARLDDNFDDDPRIVSAGLDGAGLLVMLLTFSNRNLADGWVSAGTVRKMTVDHQDGAGLVARMVTVGLLAAEPRDGIDGFRIHKDFVDLQPTKEQVEENRAAAKARKDRWLERQRNGVGTAFPRRSERRRNASGTPHPDPDPDPVEKKDTSALEGFSAFYAAYPKKKSRGQAESAWRALRPSASLQRAILDAVERQKQSHDWVKDSGQWIPYPSSWLRAKRWEDEPGKSNVHQSEGVRSVPDVDETYAKLRKWREEEAAHTPLPSSAEKAPNGGAVPVAMGVSPGGIHHV